MPELPEVETIRRDLGKKIINKKIPIFLLRIMRLLFFSCDLFCKDPTNPYGINKLLLNMVANAIDETIIIEIAAENPPRKTKTVSMLLLKNCGINKE